MIIACDFCGELLNTRNPSSCSCGNIIIKEERITINKHANNIPLIIYKESLQDYLNSNFENLNQFCDFVRKDKNSFLSKTYLRDLLLGKHRNPSLKTILELARVTGINEEEIFNEFCYRYRDRRTGD